MIHATGFPKTGIYPLKPAGGLDIGLAKLYITIFYLNNPSAMKSQQATGYASRREFIGNMAVNAGLLSMASAFVPHTSAGEHFLPPGNDLKNAEAWFSQVKGNHRVAFDCTQPHEIFPFAWPRVFLLSNEATGSTEGDCGVVVVLRHAAICYAMESSLWEKYKFGEVFAASDPKTSKPATRNPFWEPAASDFKIPGFGPVAIGINELQESGVMFCVCEAAMTVYSTRVADGLKKDPKEVKAEWMGGLLPGIQPVPSGVWALGRAQEKGCSYIFAG
jgi:intracellular sulfur oxidation DsrE/DsrF family protein